MTTAIRPLPGKSREYHFPRFSRQTLDNGMQLIVARVTKLPVVSVMAVIDATALDDAPGREGVAELTAQALKEGTTQRDGASLILDLERLGTSLESGADWDSTVLSMTVLRHRLPNAFSLFAEALLSPAFRVEDVDRLKSERLAERLQILAEPRGLADESFARFVYASDSRYSLPVSGNSRSVQSISRADVVSFYQSNYVPSRTTLIVAGDIELEESVKLAESALGKWRGDGTVLARKAAAPTRTSRAVEIVAKPDAAQSELRMGHVGVARTHPDYFNIVVMNAILGGLFSSRINLNLREEHGYTYGASSYYDWRREPGPFVISTAVQSDATAAAVSETLKEINRMRDEEIDEEELTLATNYLAGVFPIRYETTSAIAAALANLVTFGLPDDYYDTYRDNINAVSTRSVLEAARAHVHPEKIQTLIVGNPEIVHGPIEELHLGVLTLREVVEA